NASLADQLVVDGARRRVRALQAVAQLLVVQRTVHVRFDIVGRVRDLVSRFVHSSHVLSVAGEGACTPCAASHSLRLWWWNEDQAGFDTDGAWAGIQLRRSGRLAHEPD